jgi:hypothetical protein
MVLVGGDKTVESEDSEYRVLWEALKPELSGGDVPATDPRRWFQQRSNGFRSALEIRKWREQMLTIYKEFRILKIEGRTTPEWRAIDAKKVVSQ